MSSLLTSVTTAHKNHRFWTLLGSKLTTRHFREVLQTHREGPVSEKRSKRWRNAEVSRRCWSEDLLLTAPCVTPTTWLTASDVWLLTSPLPPGGREEEEQEEVGEPGRKERGREWWWETSKEESTTSDTFWIWSPAIFQDPCVVLFIGRCSPVPKLWHASCMLQYEHGWSQ